LCLLTISGDDPSAANSITTKQVASLSKIKSKIQSNSPQRCRPTQPSHKVHDSEEFLQASRNASSAVLDHHAAQDELKDQSIKEFKQLNLVAPPTEKKRGGSPESEPDVCFSPCDLCLMLDTLLKVHASEMCPSARIQACPLASLTSSVEYPLYFLKWAEHLLGIISKSSILTIQIIILRKRLERTDVSREALQQQCLEAMEKAARCSITHQQSLHHLQQISEMHPENHTIPTSLCSTPQ
jgi:hypothetical protein